MKTFLNSKMMCVLSLSMISVLYSATPVQAAEYCCCCAGPGNWCEEKTEDCATQCNSFQVGTCPNAFCTNHCTSMANEDTTIIESFMPDEYVDEVIAMDEDCTDEADETAEIGTEE